MLGDHSRRSAPTDGGVYVAGIDVGGGAGDHPEDGATGTRDRDSTVVTIARVKPVEIVPGIAEPRMGIVDHLAWTGRDQHAQVASLLATLRDVWRCRRIVVDATGLGAGTADFLRAALGDVVERFTFTADTKSRLGFALLAAINGGRLRTYAEESPANDCAATFWRQMTACRATLVEGRRLRFGVPDAEGHDDYVMSAALCVRAAGMAMLLPATAVVGWAVEFADGRY